MARVMGHAMPIMASITGNEENKMEIIGDLRAAIMSDLLNHVYCKHATNSGFLAINEEEKERFLHSLELFGVKNIDEAVDGLSGAMQKLGLPVTPEETLKGIIRREVMHAIAMTMVNDYAMAKIPPTNVQIAACMNGIEQELGITCKEVMGKDIISYIESGMVQRKSKHR